MRTQEYGLRLKWAGCIVLRSGAIGLISGGILGTLFGCAYFPVALVVGLLGAGLGLGLGLVNGLLLSLLSCLFFYPLQYLRFYHAIAKMVPAVVAAGGTVSFGPWYFSSTALTPSSAVLIGLSSVIASIIAGWAGWLAGHNIAQWYEQQWYEQQWAGREKKLSGSTAYNGNLDSNLTGRSLTATLRSIGMGWGYVALFSLLCSFVGRRLLQYLICDTQDVFYCLPSPRLYTSVAAGLKVTFPAVLVAILIVSLLQSRIIGRCFRVFR